MSDAVTFVHLTDLHAVAAPEAGDDACLGNLDRLAAVMTTIAAIAPRPDFVVVSGDITDRGDPDSYRRVRAVVEAHGLKTLYALGNHDSRPGFYAGMLDDPAGCHDCRARRGF
jgi:3',5'-cyclic AMP phosphodiesterase CpdA